MGDVALWDDSSESEDDIPAKRYRYRPYVDFECDRDSHERFRLTRRQAELLLRLLGARLDAGGLSSKNFTAEQKLLMGLRYFASNQFYYGVGDAQGPSKATVCRAVKAVTFAIIDALNGTIGWPNEEQRCRELARDFARKAVPGMPNVCGAVDGTLVKITPPKETENSYVDRHHDHSINVLAVSDAKGRFLFLSARWPGSINDARILRNSALKAGFDAGYRPFPNAVLLGDSAFAASDWLVPMQNYFDIDDRNLRSFYRCHAKTRVEVEQQFGIWKNRFQCLKSKIRVADVTYAASIIKACGFLQNFIVDNRLPDEDDDDQFLGNGETEDHEGEGEEHQVQDSHVRVQAQIESFYAYNDMK